MQQARPDKTDPTREDCLEAKKDATPMGLAWIEPQDVDAADCAHWTGALRAAGCSKVNRWSGGRPGKFLLRRRRLFPQHDAALEFRRADAGTPLP